MLTRVRAGARMARARLPRRALPPGLREDWVDDIPIVWVRPADGVDPKGSPVALWIDHFTGSARAVEPRLVELAGMGFTAVSIDPWLHGRRARRGINLPPRVFGDFQRHMWAILGRTALDAVRVLDWLQDNHTGPAPVAAGGVSMGGDIAVALGGLDQRVHRVAALAATPDWLRPGMMDPDEPTRPLPPGRPDRLSQWYYDHLNPMTNLERFTGRPAILFECGAEDTLVPAEAATRFRQSLAQPDQQVEVVVRAGLDHGQTMADPAANRHCLQWLGQVVSPPG